MAAFQRIKDNYPGCGRISREHLGAVHGAEKAGDKGKAARSIIEAVRHHVVGIGPDAVVRIVAEVAAVCTVAVGHRKRVARIGAGGVGRGGYSHALIEDTARVGGGSKLRE